MKEKDIKLNISYFPRPPRENKIWMTLKAINMTDKKIRVNEIVFEFERLEDEKLIGMMRII